MNSPPARLRRLTRITLCGLLGASLAGCFHVNVMGHDVPESQCREYQDSELAREKQGRPPSCGHDEQGRVPSWDEFWFTVGGLSPDPSTARSRRLRRYVIGQRRTVGLPELTCGGLGLLPALPCSLAAEVGHTTPGIVFQHYRELVEPEEAARYWNIRPASAPTNVVPMLAATA